jgi:type I restriction enzyme S subunit
MTASNVTEAGLDAVSVLFIPEAMAAEKQMLRSNDVLITASSGSLSVVGRAVRIDGNSYATFGAFCKVLRPGSMVDPSYFAHFFKTSAYRALISRLAAGANINNLKKEDLDALRIPLPPLPEQRRIASILDQADQIRQAQKASTEQLDSVASAALGDLLAKSQVEKAIELRDIAEIQTGPFGSLLHSEDYVIGGIPLVNPTHLLGGRIKTDSRLAVSEEKYAELAPYALQAGDVVLGRRGEMGRAASVTEAHGRLLCGTGSMIIRPNAELVLGIVLAEIFATRKIRNSLERRAQGVTMLNLNQKIVGDTLVRVPPVRAQMRYAARLSRMEHLRSKFESRNALLDELFASLHHKAFNGEL